MEHDGLDAAPLRVFLSHTSELRAYPSPPLRSFVAAAQDAVDRARNVSIDMASFTAREQQPADYCRQQVQQAGVYVGLIGFRYGSPVRDQLELSYTELEFQVASEQGLPRLIFMLDEKKPLPLPSEYLYDPDPEYQRRQQAFRARLQAAEVIFQRVDSPEQLELKLFHALVDLRQTAQRIEAGLQRERQPPPRPAVRQAKFVNPPPMVAPGWFQDRQVETRSIGDFLRNEGLRMLTVVGRGGIGKTALVCRLLRAVERGQLPDDGGPLPVDGIVYLSPVGAHPVSFPNLFADLCQLPQAAAQQLETLYRDRPQTPRLAQTPLAQTPRTLMLALLEAFPTGQTLVLLDNLEDVLSTETHTITDSDLDEALRTLLEAPHHTVKILATSQIPPADLLQVDGVRHRRFNLDAGLPSPDAENLLRAMDPGGQLGLQTAPDALLSTACERTRGYPRALEALVASLYADRAITLRELLDQLAQVTCSPDRVVEVLVGEAFKRLDPLAQRVMQALAIYGLPVPPVAVDYLLRPYRPAIDSKPVLDRLVNMYFAHRDAGHYYLHQVDRDYVLCLISAGQSTDRDADPPPFTRYGLRHQAADYFKRTRTPQESWRSLDDLAPQLAEFELRCQGEDYDTAAQILLSIDSDYLILWGHYLLTIDLHQRLQGHLTNRKTDANSKTNLGNCYYSLGQIPKAIDFYQQALDINREIGNRQGEGANLGGLGSCYADLGQTQQAIDFCKQALGIDQDVNNRRGQGIRLNNIGLCYRRLGQTQQAIDFCQQALTVAHDIGDHHGEGIRLGNLGTCYAELGQTQQAIDSYHQALAVAHDIGSRYLEGMILLRLGEVAIDLGDRTRALERCQQAIAIGDRIEVAQVQAEARRVLAEAYLTAEEWSDARQAAELARTFSYPQVEPRAALVLGTALAREGDFTGARAMLKTAIAAADKWLKLSGKDREASYVRALAQCGRAIVDAQESAATPLVTTALATVQEAMALNSDAGVLARTLRFLDIFAAIDSAGQLIEIRRVIVERPVVRQAPAHEAARSETIARAQMGTLHVFLCHASEDKEPVRRLYGELKKSGFYPWLDEEDILPGQNWDREIESAVRAADIILVCLSTRSEKRGYVQKEIARALNLADEQPEDTIYIIPVRLEPCTVPDRLRKWQWVDLFSENGYSRLLAALSKARTALSSSD